MKRIVVGMSVAMLAQGSIPLPVSALTEDESVTSVSEEDIETTEKALDEITEPNRPIVTDEETRETVESPIIVETKEDRGPSLIEGESEAEISAKFDEEWEAVADGKKSKVGDELKWFVGADGGLHVGYGTLKAMGYGGYEFYYATKDAEYIEFHLPVIGWANLNKVFLSTNATRIDGLKNIDVSAVGSMSQMFEGANRLQSLDLNGWDVSNLNNASSMFQNSNIKTLKIDEWRPVKLSDMSSMFAGMKGLRTLDLTGWETPRLSTLNMTFLGSDKLETIKGLEGFNSEYLRDLSSSFKNCDNLKLSNELKDWNVSKVTSFRSMFANDVYMKSLDLSGWNTAMGLDFGNMFSNTRSLEEVKAGEKWNVSKARDMSYMFNESGLRNYGFLENWDVSNVTTMAAMFGFVTIDEIDISNWKTDSLQRVNSMFKKGNTNVVMDFSGFNMSKVNDSERMFEEFRFKNNTAIGFDKWDTPLLKSSKYMFWKSDISDASFANEWNMSSASEIEGMFASTANLVDIDLNNWDTSSITNMRGVFADSGVNKINVESWDVSNVTNAEIMFRGAKNVKNLDLSGWNLNKVTNMNSMLSGMTKLKSLNLSNWNVNSGASTGSLFLNTDALDKLDLTDAAPFPNEFFDTVGMPNEMYVGRDWYLDSNPNIIRTSTDLDGVIESGVWLRVREASSISTPEVEDNVIDLGTITIGDTKGRVIDVSVLNTLNMDDCRYILSAYMDKEEPIIISMKNHLDEWDALTEDGVRVNNEVKEGRSDQGVKMRWTTRDNATPQAISTSITWELASEVLSPE